MSTEASQISSTLSPDLHQVSIPTSHALSCYLSHLSHLGAKAEQRETTFNSESGFYPNYPSAWFSTGTLGEHAAPQLSGLSALTTAPYPSWWPDMEYSIFKIKENFDAALYLARLHPDVLSKVNSLRHCYGLTDSSSRTSDTLGKLYRPSASLPKLKVHCKDG